MQDYLVIDFEFTTHDSNYGKPRAFFQEIIEVGAVLLEGEKLDKTYEYQAFIKPQFFPRLTEACKNITLITQDDVNRGIRFADMLEEVAKKYKPRKTCIVAWGDADWQVISYACKRYNLTCPFNFEDYIDLANEYKIFYSLERHMSLKNAILMQEIESHGLYHCALDDAINTVSILKKMLNDGWQPKAALIEKAMAQ